jgi:hypothetical protein
MFNLLGELIGLISFNLFAILLLLHFELLRGRLKGRITTFSHCFHLEVSVLPSILFLFFPLLVRFEVRGAVAVNERLFLPAKVTSFFPDVVGNDQ